MLTNTYQHPAEVRCQRPPGLAYRVEASIAIPTVPEPQAKGVDKNQEADVGGNGIAKLARAAARRCPRTLYEPAKPSTSTT
jgi:hypothetical protein